VRRNKDSLLRAAAEKHLLASATMGGSCTHPDQSRGLARRRNVRAIPGAGVSTPLLLFFLLGGVALHERLVGKANTVAWGRLKCGNCLDTVSVHCDTRSEQVICASDTS